MRLDKNRPRNQGRRMLTVLATLALSLFGLFTVQRLWLDSARLVSIQDVGDSCYLPTGDDATPPGESLFTQFETPVHAQDIGRTLDVDRQPVRDLIDTLPLYG